MEHNSYSLSELCEAIGEGLSSALPDTYWVRAEIGSMSERGGHCYMELVEKSDGNGLQAAKMRANCWQNIWSILSVYFRSETGLPLQTGMQVLLEAAVSFHSLYGLSLQVIGIDPSYTMGDMARQRQHTLERLQAEGVMDMQQTLRLSAICQRIAVVSSADAAGYGDFRHQIENNPYRFRFQMTLFPSLMQGERAPQTIVSALEQICNRCDEFDVVVIIRGGGATTDLTCFDNYDLAAVCAQFPLPVLTGIGHLRDVSVLDLVSYKSLKTPTAVAEFLIAHRLTQLERLDALQQRFMQTADKRITLQRNRLETISVRLRAAYLSAFRQEHERLRTIERTLQLLSPEIIYRKGYTLTRKADGTLIRTATEICKGERITTEFIDGMVHSVIS